ncbi:hypothetical protein B0H19DRAFT_197340 [Mycena capillaripes]|nr:hypothetical protein B0H19DRAFT_197340 [Mycena capillaripes]
MAASLGLVAQTSRDQVPADASSQAAVMAFNIISAIGFILLAAVFFTALLSSSVRRVSTWYLYMLAWMAFCITPFLVIGHQTRLDPPPSFVPCVIDSALMYASRPFAGFATLSLIVQLYLNISCRLKRGEVRPECVFVLLAVPPILYLIIFLSTLIVGALNPDQVELEPGGFYCHLNNSIPAIVVGALVVFASSAALLVEVLTVILLSRNWRAFRSLQRRNEHAVSLSIMIRVSVFAILPVIGLGLSFTTYVPNLVVKIFPAYNILLASLPTAAGFIFGSQTDIIHAWMFWRRKEKTASTDLGLSTYDSTIKCVP